MLSVMTSTTVDGPVLSQSRVRCLWLAPSGGRAASAGRPRRRAAPERNSPTASRRPRDAAGARACSHRPRMPTRSARATSATTHRAGRADVVAATAAAPRRANMPTSTPATTSAAHHTAASASASTGIRSLARIGVGRCAQHQGTVGRGLVGVEQVGAHRAVEVRTPWPRARPAACGCAASARRAAATQATTPSALPAPRAAPCGGRHGRAR